MKKLTDEDIRQNKYSINQLKHSIINDNISLRMVLKYQILTPYICVKYILFGGTEQNYGNCLEDKLINMNDIIVLQPHITYDQLLDTIKFVYEEEKRELMETLLMLNEDKNIEHL